LVAGGVDFEGYDMRYLFITEDGEIYAGDTVTASEKSGCEDGILDIIDMDKCKQYEPLDKIWIDITPWHFG